MTHKWISRSTGVKLMDVEKTGTDRHGAWVKGRVYSGNRGTWSRTAVKDYGQVFQTEHEARAAWREAAAKERAQRQKAMAALRDART